jgi:glycosyltransferase involved in cell wall biosynthesis
MNGILHIINGYTGNKAYKNLVTTIDSLGIRQWIYIPVRNPGEQSRYQNFDLKKTAYTYSYIIRSIFDRIFFFRKIRKISRDIERNEHFSPDMQIHAHTLFSDGGVALSLHRKHQMKYLVAVRNTDVNFFYKYFFFLRRYGEAILCEAKQVIFLSPAYRERILNRYISEKNRTKIRQKSMVIPNGTDPFWQENIYYRNEFNSKQIRLLYVGEIRRNKNLQAPLSAIRLLRDRGSDVRLSVVGFGLNDENNYARRIRKLCETLDDVNLFDQVQDKEILMKHYREADIFIMPSFAETFGLVYAEAMSQGLPLIYSKGQGIDGYFTDGEAGYAVNPRNPEEIADKIQKILEGYKEITRFCSSQALLFSQERIVMIYKTLYEK